MFGNFALNIVYMKTSFAMQVDLLIKIPEHNLEHCIFLYTNAQEVSSSTE